MLFFIHAGPLRDCKGCGSTFPLLFKQRHKVFCGDSCSKKFFARKKESTKLNLIRAWWSAKANIAAVYLALLVKREKLTEARRAQRRRWRSLNATARRVQRKKEKLIRRGITGHHTAADLRAIFDSQNGHCPICRVFLANRYHVDHVMPIALGGTNNKENIQLLCARCNIEKGAKHPMTFLQEKGLLI